MIDAGYLAFSLTAFNAIAAFSGDIATDGLILIDLPATIDCFRSTPTLKDLLDFWDSLYLVSATVPISVRAF